MFNHNANFECQEVFVHSYIDRLGKRGPKVEKKSSVQVAFAHGSSLATIRSYGVPREGNSSKSNGLGSRDSAVDDEQILFSLPSTGEPYGTSELLDEAEFGDAADNLDYDENTISSALELGLMVCYLITDISKLFRILGISHLPYTINDGQEEIDKPQMLFLQFPPNLPLPKRSAGADGNESKGASASAKGKEIAGKSKSIGSTGASVAVKGKEIMSSLEGLPGGYMGKMLVYKSGAIKWKLGDVVYDVSPGLNCVAAQDVVAINTVDKNCCALGELSKRAVVTPDINSLLDNVIDLD
ncbi:hypothetical protein RHMOL_Rhmol09G0004500 [Rhododendron molle]|uniref:Uncharacterized protein n=1 Tax=Rhododendron molle TaxID=49168 RepID=A0ACC0M9A9_RHOML|nr:hypothetical protein RHMOL_Rhmol09G0004500 [Rhododendron molle]